MHWKHFLGYPEYVEISRNTFQAALENLYLFGHELQRLDYYFAENFTCKL